MDSHGDLINESPYSDDDDCEKFVRIEIVPINNDYMHPNDWRLQLDSEYRPRWFSPEHEHMCMKSKDEWYAELEKYLVRKEIIHPFNDITPPKIISKKIKTLLKKWDSVKGSVWDSIEDSIKDSVEDSVRDSVWDSIEDSVVVYVRDSVWGSIWYSIEGYVGSFFNIKKWKHIKHNEGEYPFQSIVDLWEIYGLVPSFDGAMWRLHGGKDAKVLFEISQRELREYGE